MEYTQKYLEQTEQFFREECIRMGKNPLMERLFQELQKRGQRMIESDVKSGVEEATTLVPKLRISA